MAVSKIITAAFEKLPKGGSSLECQRAEEVYKGEVATFSILFFSSFRPFFITHPLRFSSLIEY